MLAISLFGGLRLAIDAHAWTFSALPKTTSLLGYLLLRRDRPVARDTVAFALWPDAPEAIARANLRRHLHDLRHALPPTPADAPWLASDRNAVQWNPRAPFWLDLAEFERLCTIPERLAEAATLYTGDLLPLVYDDWIFFERERFHDLHLTVLRRLLAQHRGLGQYDVAISYARQLAGLEPLREDFSRDLIALQYQAGDRSAALQEYARLARLLSTELGVTPVPETVALYERIRSGAEPSASTVAPAVPPAPHAIPPLEPASTFGGFLRYLRIRTGLTQRELAVRVGYSEAQISRLEQDRRHPPRAVLLAKFVPALGIQGDSEARARLLDLAGSVPVQQPEQPERAEPGESHGQTTSGAPALTAAARGFPAWLTSLVGRESELDEIARLLGASGVRLLTLFGPGGAGKTRLAAEAGSTLASHFADGAAFVNLASLASADFVAGAIAAALELAEAPGRDPEQALRTGLAAAELLLVLDNFEHLPAAAGLVHRLLVRCPRVKVLATSRELLHLGGEQAFVVSPLSVPDAANLPPLSTLAASPAVSLFVQRSRAVRQDFALTAQNASAVSAIVTRLDGLPLAIELAAARSRYLAPESLLARLSGAGEGGSRSLQMLSGGPADLPARHRTLHDTIAWSYALLEPDQQLLFLRLALFGDTFDLAGAAAVGRAAPGLSSDVEECVAALLDKSLIYRYPSVAGSSEVRFAMLATLREFALALLGSGPDLAAVRAAFVGFYAGLAERAAAGWRSPDQGRWLEWARVEEANLRQALAMSVGEASQPGLAGQGARILLGLDRFWRQMARITETRKWLGCALAHSPEFSAEERARLLTVDAFFAMLAGAPVSTVMELHEAARSLAREAGGDDLMIDVLEAYGTDATKARQNELAVGLVTEALALERARSGGMTMRVAVLTNILSTIYYNQGNLPDARAVLEEVLPFVRKHGTLQQLCAILTNVSNMARALGDFARDRECLAEVWALQAHAGDTMAQLHLLTSVAERAYMQGQAALGSRLHSATEAAAAQLGFVFPPAYQAEFDRYVAGLRESLGGEAFAAEWARGAGLTMPQAIELGLAER